MRSLKLKPYKPSTYVRVAKRCAAISGAVTPEQVAWCAHAKARPYRLQHLVAAAEVALLASPLFDREGFSQKFFVLVSP